MNTVSSFLLLWGSLTDALNFGGAHGGSPPSLMPAITHDRSRDWEVSTPSHAVSKPFIPPRPALFTDFICVLVQNAPSPQYDSAIPAPLLPWWLRPPSFPQACSSLPLPVFLPQPSFTLQWSSLPRKDLIPASLSLTAHHSSRCSLLPDRPDCNCVPASGPLHVCSLCLEHVLHDSFSDSIGILPKYQAFPDLHLHQHLPYPPCLTLYRIHPALHCSAHHSPTLCSVDTVFCIWLFISVSSREGRDLVPFCPQLSAALGTSDVPNNHLLNWWKHTLYPLVFLIYSRIKPNPMVGHSRIMIQTSSPFLVLSPYHTILTCSVPWTLAKPCNTPSTFTPAYLSFCPLLHRCSLKSSESLKTLRHALCIMETSLLPSMPTTDSSVLWYPFVYLWHCVLSQMMSPFNCFPTSRQSIGRGYSLLTLKDVKQESRAPMPTEARHTVNEAHGCVRLLRRPEQDSKTQGLTQQIQFLTVLETRSPRSRCLQVGCWWGPSSWLIDVAHVERGDSSLLFLPLLRQDHLSLGVRDPPLFFNSIYLAAMAPSCSTQHLPSSLWCVGPLVAAWELLAAACGIQFPDQGSNLGLLH